MTTAFQTHISDIYEATKLITGSLDSVEAFLLTDGSAAEVATFKPALDTEINALSSKTAKSSAELLYLTVVVENTNVNGVPASSLSGFVDPADVIALPASHITGLADVATGGALAASLVSGLDSAVGNLNYIKIASVNTALASYTPTSGLEPVATGGTLAASLVILEESATTYITDNRGFQIPTGTNVNLGLMVVDAKIGQLDTVVVKDSAGVIVGQETPNNIFDVASMLQAQETKTGYNANMEYPISPSVANFNSITTHKLQFYSSSLCSAGNLVKTIDVTSSKKPLDVLFGYLSCEMVPYNLSNNNIYLKQDDGATCPLFAAIGSNPTTAAENCHYYFFNDFIVG